MIKRQIGSIIYYYKDDDQLALARGEALIYNSDLPLVTYAECVLDTETNRVIKMRQSIEDVYDKFIME